jgi:hypothetical protein
MEILEDRCLPSALSPVAVNPQPLPPGVHSPLPVANQPLVLSPTLPLPPPRA